VSRTEPDLIYRASLEKAAQTGPIFHAEYTLFETARFVYRNARLLQTALREIWEKAPRSTAAARLHMRAREDGFKAPCAFFPRKKGSWGVPATARVHLRTLND